MHLSTAKAVIII